MYTFYFNLKTFVSMSEYIRSCQEAWSVFLSRSGIFDQIQPIYTLLQPYYHTPNGAKGCQLQDICKASQHANCSKVIRQERNANIPNRQRQHILLALKRQEDITDTYFYFAYKQPTFLQSYRAGGRTLWTLEPKKFIAKQILSSKPYSPRHTIQLLLAPLTF